MADFTTWREKGEPQYGGVRSSLANAGLGQVNVLVNGHAIPFNMKIGEAGEAFFVFETDEDVPEDLMTSPILQATNIDSGSRAAVGGGEQKTGRFGAKDEPRIDGDTNDIVDGEEEREDKVGLGSCVRGRRMLTSVRMLFLNQTSWISMRLSKQITMCL